MKFKTLIPIFMIVLLVCMPLVLATGNWPTTDNSKTTSNVGDAKEGLVNLGELSVKPSQLGNFFDPTKISDANIKGLSNGCPQDFSKCTQADVNKFDKSTQSISGLKYDVKTDTFTIDGSTYKYAKDGSYYVENNVIKNFQGKQIGSLPSNTKITDVKSVQKNIVEFNDGSAMVKNKVIPAGVYNDFKSLIDVNKESSDNQILFKGDQGGSLVITEDGGITTATVKYSQDAEENKIYYSPDGESYSANDGWTLNNQQKLINNEKKEAITFTKMDDYIKTEKEDLNSKEKTTTFVNNDGSKTTQDYINEKGNYVLQYSETILKDGSKIELDFSKENGQDVQKGSYYNPDGRLIGSCYEDCYNDQNGNPNENNYVWATNDAYCLGTKTECYDDKGNPIAIPGKWNTEDNCGEKTSASCKAINAKENEMFWHFEGGFWDIGLARTDIQKNYITPIVGGLSSIGDWQGLSTWLLPSSGWMKDAADAMDRAMLISNIVPKAACNFEGNHVDRPGEASTFISVAPGIVQHVGTIRAEKTPQASTALCSEELPCNIGECNPNGICYQNEKPVMATFYKITWGVQAPQDEKFTPYYDENGVAISYNIRLEGNSGQVWLYPAVGGNDESLKLDNGQSDGDTYVTYSTNDYDQACIYYGKPPEDLSGAEITSQCVNIIESTKGEIEWEYSDKKGSKARSESSKVNDLGRKEI